jgi:hypothetical protein
MRHGRPPGAVRYTNVRGEHSDALPGCRNSPTRSVESVASVGRRFTERKRNELVSFAAAELDAQVDWGTAQDQFYAQKKLRAEDYGVPALTLGTGSLVRFDCRLTHEVDPSVKSVSRRGLGIRVTVFVETRRGR